TAQRLRDGKLEAMAAHREAIAKLRAEAAKILISSEHTATEATLRRVTQTLAALAASGGWEPDPPGALSADREPPGFEAIGVSSEVPLPVIAQAKESKRQTQHARAERAEAAADLRRAEAERAKAAAERHRIEAALRTAQGDVTQREREVVKLERDLAAARNMVTQARAVVQGLEERLAQLHN